MAYNVGDKEEWLKETKGKGIPTPTNNGLNSENRQESYKAQKINQQRFQKKDKRPNIKKYNTTENITNKDNKKVIKFPQETNVIKQPNNNEVKVVSRPRNRNYKSPGIAENVSKNSYNKNTNKIVPISSKDRREKVHDNNRLIYQPMDDEVDNDFNDIPNEEENLSTEPDNDTNPFEEQNEELPKEENEKKDLVNDDLEPETSDSKKPEKTKNPIKNKINKETIKGTADIAKNKLLAFIAKNPYVLVAILFIILFFLLLILIITIFNGSSMENSQNTNSSSMCNTSSNEANIYTFIDTFEGDHGRCSDTEYKGKNTDDGTITIGYGVTNHDFGSVSTVNYINENGWGSYFRSNGSSYYINAGDCIPVEIIDKIEINSIENNYAKPIYSYMEEKGIQLTQYEIDAITSFNYNVGPGHTEKLIDAYINNGYEGFWNAIKDYKYSKGEVLSGLMKRRKAEFALFVTGDYTDQGIFSSRSTDNYENYDSEGVMARKAICDSSNSGGYLNQESSLSGFMVPLEIPKNGEKASFYCSSPYGHRWGRLHAGIDFASGGVQGIPIYASKDGVVIASRNDVSGAVPSTGNFVSIQHEDGTVTKYFHMKKGSVLVQKGDVVKQGQQIGGVGNTGRSTGPHLHFEIYDASGKSVDPYNYLDLSFLGDTSRCHK